MGFIKSFLTVACACVASASPLDFHAENQLVKRTGGVCTDISQFVAPVVAGDTTAGTPFCESDWDASYIPITSITAWWSGYNVEGIQATYADGSQSPVYGSTGGGYTGSISVDYAQGERWTGWTMYYWLPAYGGNQYVTALYLAANNNQTMEAGMNPYELGQTDVGYYPITQGIGSGFLFGFNGTADTTAISSLSGFFLESEIANIQITDLAFPDGPTGSQDISIESLASAHYYNGETSGETTWSFENQDAITTTHTFMQTVTNTYGTTEAIGIQASIPTILSVTSTTTFMWSTAYATANTYTYTDTVTVSWSEGGSLEPGTGVDCVAEVGHGQGTFPYTSTVTITLKNGFVFSYTEDGALTIDDISTAIVEVTTDNNQ